MQLHVGYYDMFAEADPGCLERDRGYALLISHFHGIFKNGSEHPGPLWIRHWFDTKNCKTNAILSEEEKKKKK